jgi:hypothetical protein
LSKPKTMLPRRPLPMPILSLAFALITLCATAPLALAGHVILISCDGMRPDAIKALGAEKAPNLHRLIAEGASTFNARTDADMTVTLPNHTAMVTGRGVKGDAGHNWTSNATPRIGKMLHRNKKAYLRSMFGVAHDHGMRTGLFASKAKFILYDHSYDERNGSDDSVGEDDGKDKIDVYEFEEKTEILVSEFIAANTEKPFQLAMLHLRDPDTSGHSKGWDLTEGSVYMGALMKIDGLIGDILEAIEADASLKGKTHLIVTADHGGRLSSKTHIKSDEPLNYTIPFLVWGPGISTGAELYKINPTTRKNPGEAAPRYEDESLPPIRNGDAGNLAMKLLGLPAIEGSTINAKQNLEVSAQ